MFTSTAIDFFLLSRFKNPFKNSQRKLFFCCFFKSCVEKLRESKFFIKLPLRVRIRRREKHRNRTVVIVRARSAFCLLFSSK